MTKTAANQGLKLTNYKYPPRSSETLTDIQLYLKSYEENWSHFKNPFNGNIVSLTEILDPMVRPKFIVPGTILMLIAFVVDLYILKNLGSVSTELLSYLSYVIFGCAIVGATLLLPTFIIITLNRIHHINAKRKARKLKDATLKKELPDLTEISNGLITQLAKDYSPIITNLAEVFGGLKKVITADQLTTILNIIFADEPTDPAPFVSDMDKFEQGQSSFVTMLQNGIDYGIDYGVVEDPKFVQFLSYAFAIGFLRHASIKQDAEYDFANLSLEEFGKIYQNFYDKFIDYCRTEYGAKLTKEHVEDRIVKLMDDFIIYNEIKIERVFPNLAITKK